MEDQKTRLAVAILGMLWNHVGEADDQGAELSDGTITDALLTVIAFVNFTSRETSTPHLRKKFCGAAARYLAYEIEAFQDLKSRGHLEYADASVRRQVLQ